MNKARSQNSLGLGLIIIGAIVMALAAFLPLDEPTSASGIVEQNTLIQHDGGWQLIWCAVLIAGFGYGVNVWTGKGWQVPVVGCVYMAFKIIMWATDKGLRTVYPVGPDGNPIANQPGTVVPLGIAIYVAGAGVVVALIGSLILRQTAVNYAKVKKCPDCGETILIDAKVCEHCGHHFPLTNVTCNHCQHPQAVPLSQQRFKCEQCGAKLKRPTPPVKGS